MMEDQKSQLSARAEEYQPANPVEHHLELLKQSFGDLGKAAR